MSLRVLAADVGGTKTNLGLFVWERGRLRALREHTVPTAAHPGPGPLLRAFLGPDEPPPQAVGLGVAGPVVSGRAAPPNLPWTVDGGRLARDLGLDRVVLVNDLVATALGVDLVAPDRIATLQAGEPDPGGNRAVIAAGTGLGQALLVRCGTGWHPVASEGGHAGFAPADETEVDLLRYLAARHGAVSAERVVSGPGLAAVYRFVVDTGRAAEAPRVAAAMAGADPAAVVGREGLAGTDPACREALDLWVRAYGSEAGNLALRTLATGGLYVAGGIAPKVLPRLREGGFLAAFRAKGRMAPFLERVPVRVVLDPKAALYGAARRALEEAGCPIG